MSKRRPQYVQDRIDFTLQRQRHAREAAPGCRCVFCLKTEEIEALIRERIRLSVLLHGEPPF